METELMVRPDLPDKLGLLPDDRDVCLNGRFDHVIRLGPVGILPPSIERCYDNVIRRTDTGSNREFKAGKTVTIGLDNIDAWRPSDIVGFGFVLEVSDGENDIGVGRDFDLERKGHNIHGRMWARAEYRRLSRERETNQGQAIVKPEGSTYSPRARHSHSPFALISIEPNPNAHGGPHAA